MFDDFVIMRMVSPGPPDLFLAMLDIATLDRGYVNFSVGWLVFYLSYVDFDWVTAGLFFCEVVRVVGRICKEVEEGCCFRCLPR